MAFGDGSVVLLQNSVTRGSSMRMSSKTCEDRGEKQNKSKLKISPTKKKATVSCDRLLYTRYTPTGSASKVKPFCVHYLFAIKFI